MYYIYDIPCNWLEADIYKLNQVWVNKMWEISSHTSHEKLLSKSNLLVCPRLFYHPITSEIIRALQKVSARWKLRDWLHCPGLRNQPPCIFIGRSWSARDWIVRLWPETGIDGIQARNTSSLLFRAQRYLITIPFQLSTLYWSRRTKLSHRMSEPRTNLATTTYWALTPSWAVRVFTSEFLARG